MKLADLRRMAIKSGARIHFPLADGMECVVNEHGIAQVPGMRAAGDCNLEDELGRASQFTLESLAPEQKNKPRTQILTREQMAAMVEAKTSAAVHDDHDE